MSVKTTINYDARFDRIEESLDKSATTIVKGFDRTDKALENKPNKQDIERVLASLDALARRQEISDDERLVMGHQLERLNRWTHELAQKIGYELSA